MLAFYSKMLGVWCLFLCLTTTSESYVMSGVIDSIKTFSENFPWPILNKNNSDDLETTSTSSKLFASPDPQLTEILTEVPVLNKEGNEKYEPDITSKFVQTSNNNISIEWKIRQHFYGFSNTVPYPEDPTLTTFNSSEVKYNELKAFLERVQNVLEMNQYSSIRERFPGGRKSNEKMFSIHYAISIPNTIKYQEIKISNMTKNQFNRIESMFTEYSAQIFRRNSSNSSFSERSVSSAINDTYHKKVTRALTDLESPDFNPVTTAQYNRPIAKGSLNNQERVHINYENIFTPEGHKDFMKSFASKSVYGESYGKTTPTINSSASIVSSKYGHHAEIVTDYKSNNDEEQMIKTLNTQKSNFSSIKNDGEYEWNRDNPNKDRTLGEPQTRTKRPILNVLSSRRNTKYNLLPVEKVTTIYENSSLNQENTNTFVRNPANNQQETKIVLDSQDWLDFSKFISNVEDSLTHPNSKVLLNSTTPLNSTQDPNHILADSSDIIRAANWLVGMHHRLEEQKTLMTEQYNKLIKEKLGGESAGLYFGKDDNGSIMKINKEDNTLEGIKGFMLEYFKTLNFKIKDNNTDQFPSMLQKVMDSTNIFELLESSSQYVKQNLKSKLEVKQEMPPSGQKGFVIKIVEKQKNLCTQIFTDTKKQFTNTTNSTSFSKTNPNKKFKTFTNCINIRLKKCTRGFITWLEKGKYHLRKQFKLERAYEHYQIERGLDCLGTMRLSPLGSTPRGIRVRKPQVNVQQKNGANAKGSRPLDQVRKLKNQNPRLQATKKSNANKKNNLQPKHSSNSQTAE